MRIWHKRFRHDIFFSYFLSLHKDIHYAFFIFFVFLLITTNYTVSAQNTTWSKPVEFFEVGQGGSVQSPVLVTDSGGNLHAFWSAAQTEDETMVLYQSTWRDIEWTPATDILISPDGANTWPHEVIVGNDDYVHVFWLGVENTKIWHYRAHASQLDDPDGWVQQASIFPEQVAFGSFGLTTDSLGTWYLVYGNRSLDRITFLSSTDDGLSWSTEQTAHIEGTPGIWVGNPGIVIAPDGSLIVWWQQMESGSGRSTGLQYSIRAADQNIWDAPVKLADGYYFGGITFHDDLLIRAIGGGIGTGGRYISFSEDNGLTWKAPTNISAGSREGAQDIPWAVDSEGNLHFIVETGSLFARVEWNGGYWEKPDFVASREIMDQCCIKPGKVTENAATGISDGNLIHIFFEEDNSVIWYANRRLPVEEVKASELIAPPVDLVGEVTIENIIGKAPYEVSTSSTSVPANNFSNQEEPTDRKIDPLIIPAFIVVMLLVAILVWRNPRYPSR